MNTFRIRNRLLALCLGLALLCLGSRAWQPVHGAMADPPPDGLTLADWQAIQFQVAKLTADDGAVGEGFGDSVSVSGDMAFVGVPSATVGGNGLQGAVYIFYRDEDGPDAWGQVTKLVAADGVEVDNFGFSVSVSGDTAVVGAVGVNYARGAAYIFYRDQGGSDAWGQVAKLTVADGAWYDYFGQSVFVNGDTVIIGAFRADIGGNTDQGAAYVFYRDWGGADAWGQVAKLIATDGAVYDRFGNSVSVDGDTAVVGAYLADIDGSVNQGAAYVFYQNQGGSNTWGQVMKLTADDGGAGDYFGSVSISGDTAIVGAGDADVGSNDAQGAAYIFYRDQDGADLWGQVGKLTVVEGTEGDYFGDSVSLSGDIAVVGAIYADVGGKEDQGAAYVFYRNHGGTDTWGQAARLTVADCAAHDWFGGSVSVSGDTAVVGSQWATVGGNEAQGAAYVFSTVCISLTDVSIVGPIGITSTLYIGGNYHFQAVITPVNATPPITYTWTPTPATGQGTAETVYRWMTPGTYTITLTAENCPAPSTVVTTTRQVVVEWKELYFVYLPLVQKN